MSIKIKNLDSMINQRDWQTYWNTISIQQEQIGNLDASLRQVGKTVLGQTVGLDQLKVLINHIQLTLSLSAGDCCIDIGCGNGLVTSLLAPFVEIVLGLDFSAPLLQVALQAYTSPNIVYQQVNVTDLPEGLIQSGYYNKVWCCELWQHLCPEQAAYTLARLSQLLAPNFLVMLSGIPDKSKLRAFYNTPERWEYYQQRLASGTEQIGYWWQKDELEEIAKKSGLAIKFLSQPANYYTSHYRFDALLKSDS